tara:strand:+ start:44 stop:187 length:144 start_codon:yes stop_codon:yes gene_type:complete
MKEILNYIDQIEKDYKKGIYTVNEYSNFKSDILKTIKKNNLNSIVLY